MFRPRSLSAILALAVLAAFAPVFADAPEEVLLVILHVNDTHGKLDPPGKLGGIARLATAVRKVRDEQPGRVLFLHAGDVLSRGDALTIADGGLLSFQLLDRMGTDALTPGNGEFYFGLPNLLRLSAAVTFPVLDANIRVKGREAPPFKESFSREMAGVRVAVLGVGIAYMTHPSGAGLEDLDAVATARRLAAELRPKADLLIALTHVGAPVDGRLAVEAPGIDLIVGSHSHTKLDKPLVVPRPGGRTFIVQAGEHGQYLGRVDVIMRKTEKGFDVASVEGRLIPLDDTFAEAPDIAESLRSARQALARPIGSVEAPMDAARTARFVAEAVRAGAGAEVALLDRAAVSAPLRGPVVTEADVCRVHPWRSPVRIVALTGEEIQTFLRSRAMLVAGLTFQKTPDGIQILRVGEEPVDPKRSYRVAFDWFLLWNSPFRGREATDTGQRVDTLLVKALAALPEPVAP